MEIFRPEGKLSCFLNKLGDLMALNIITIVCCLPIVTAGAALTALYSQTLKMVKNEEGKVITGYFHAFRVNFRQATILWGTGGGCILFVILDLYLLRGFEGGFIKAYQGGLLFILALLIMFCMYLFPVLARFENTTKNTAKNAILFCIMYPIKSFLMLLINLLPVFLTCFSLRFLFVDVLLGVSGTAYLTSIYYRSLFRQFETENDDISVLCKNVDRNNQEV